MRESVLLIVIMSVSTYLVRMVPFTAMRRKITGRFLRSMLYYMPYAILSAMTIPAVFTCTGSLPASLAGFAAAMLLALKGGSLAAVSAAASAVSLLCWLFVK